MVDETTKVEEKAAEAEAPVETAAEPEAPAVETPSDDAKGVGEMGALDKNQGDQAADDVAELAEEFIGGVDEPEEVEAEPEPTAPPTEPAATEEVTPPVEAVEETKEEPATEEVAPTEDQPTAEEPDVTSHQQPKLPTQEELEAAWKKAREEALPDLVKQYALSDEVAAKLETNPGEVLPDILANVQLDAMERTYYSVMSSLPNLVQQVIQANTTMTRQQEAFHAKWPGLKGQDERVVAGCITAFRQSNPRCTLEQAIQGGGALAAMQLGVDLQEAQGIQAAQPESPPQPQQPLYKPAGAGNAGAPLPQQRPQMNEFGEMAEELLEG